ncbi:DUF7344 domain-containing protein [Haloarcula terrestris]
MQGGSVAYDSLLDLCRNQHRRIVLKTLVEEQQSVTVDDLTGVVLKYNHQISVTEASEDILTEINNSLYHTHLPKIASEGLINYNPERQLVEPTKQLDQVQPTLTTLLDADPSLKAPIELEC